MLLTATPSRASVFSFCSVGNVTWIQQDWMHRRLAKGPHVAILFSKTIWTIRPSRRSTIVSNSSPSKNPVRLLHSPHSPNNPSDAGALSAAAESYSPVHFPSVQLTSWQYTPQFQYIPSSPHFIWFKMLRIPLFFMELLSIYTPISKWKKQSPSEQLQKYKLQRANQKKRMYKDQLNQCISTYGRISL